MESVGTLAGWDNGTKGHLWECFCFWIKVKTASFRWCNGYSSTIKEGGDTNFIRSWDFSCNVWSCCNHDFSWVKRSKHVWLKSEQEFWAPLFRAWSSRTQLSFCLELNQYFEVDWFCWLCSFSSTLYFPLWSDIVLLFNWRERVIAVVDKHSIMFRTSDSEVLCNFCHRPTLNRWFIGSCHSHCHWHDFIHTLVKIFFLHSQSSWSSPQTSSPPPPLLFDRINGCHSADQGNKLVCTVTFYHHSWLYHLFFGINVRISIIILATSWW